MAATNTYKYYGSKRRGDNTARLIIEGSSTNPDKAVDKGGEVDLTEEQVKRFKAAGADLRKVKEDSDSEKSKSGSGSGSGSKSDKSDN